MDHPRWGHAAGHHSRLRWRCSTQLTAHAKAVAGEEWDRRPLRMRSIEESLGLKRPEGSSSMTSDPAQPGQGRATVRGRRTTLGDGATGNRSG